MGMMVSLPLWVIVFIPSLAVAVGTIIGSIMGSIIYNVAGDYVEAPFDEPDDFDR